METSFPLCSVFNIKNNIFIIIITIIRHLTLDLLYASKITFVFFLTTMIVGVQKPQPPTDLYTV